MRRIADTSVAVVGRRYAYPGVLAGIVVGGAQVCIQFAPFSLSSRRTRADKTVGIVDARQGTEVTRIRGAQDDLFRFAAWPGELRRAQTARSSVFNTRSAVQAVQNLSRTLS